MTIGAGYRDKIGSEITQKHGDTPIRTLRKTYGVNFANAKLDKTSLNRLVRDYESGMLPIRLAFPERF